MSTLPILEEFPYRTPKFCMFCGEKPVDKNREHVLGKWLLSITGDVKRPFRFSIDFNTKKERVFSADQFVAPACRTCNLEFGVLEEKAKPILLKLLERKPIYGFDIPVFLDWLDKIRIGIWLTFIC